MISSSVLGVIQGGVEVDAAVAVIMSEFDMRRLHRLQEHVTEYKRLDAEWAELVRATCARGDEFVDEAELERIEFDRDLAATRMAAVATYVLAAAGIS